MPALRALAAAGALGVLLCAGGCASGGGGGGGHRAHYTEPIKQLSLSHGHLAWNGFVIGMTFREAEAAAGRRLPSLGLEATDPICGFTMVDSSPGRQPLRLEFAPGGGDGARLKAIWLLLTDATGQGSLRETVLMLKERFPDLKYFVSGIGVSQPESSNTRPLYRLPGGDQILVDPRLGIYFGELCFS